MSRLSGIIFCLLLSMTASAQTITQKGVAYQYNGKKQRTPLGNVTISYDANKRSTVSVEQTGAFALTLTNLKMGDRIGLVSVKKREMMVFNQHAVDEWSVRKEPLMLILCNADEFERQKENLINIGRREAKNKYDRQKAELEVKLNASEIQLTEYESALDKAYEELERLQKNVGEYADLFARIDESEVDTLAQHAIELYHQGQVEDAIRLFEQGNYLEKLDKALYRSQQADELKIVAEQAKEQATQDSLKALQSLKAQIEAYKLNNEWDKAGELLKGLADRLNTIYDNWAYADFCYKQNHFKDAETYWRQSLVLIQKQSDKGGDYIQQKASIIHNLGNLYSATQRFSDSESAYKEALDTYRHLSNANPQAYEPYLASTLNNLGNLYFDTQRFSDSESAYKEALGTYRRLSNANPQAYEPDLASTLHNLGILYSDTQRFSDSESAYKEALEIRRRLSNANPQAYESDVADTQYNIGLLKKQEEKYDEAIPPFEEALELYRRIMKTNSAYQQWFANSLSWLNYLYGSVGNHIRAYQINEESFPMMKELYITDSSSYRDIYARILGNRSFHAIFMKQYAEAEQCAREGLEVESTQHWIASNFAAALLLQGKYGEAETIYMKYRDELKDSFLDDFRQFAEAGVIPKEREEDVEKIKRILNE